MGKVLASGGGGGGTGSDECTASKAQVLAGYTAVTSDSGDEAVAGTMPDNGDQSGTLNCGQSKVIPEGYTSGGTVTANSLADQTPGNLVAGKMLSGVYGYSNGVKVTGNIASMGAQTVTPGNAAKTVSCSGKYMTGNVTVSAVANLTAANIKKGVTVGGVTGTWEGYVATPTDLYYKGANPAGITSSSATFGATNITLSTGTHTIDLAINKTYAVSGYTRLNIQGSISTYSESVYIKNSNVTPAQTYKALNIEGGTTYTLIQFDISQMITLGSGAVIRLTTNSGTISRIWLS